LKIKVLGNVDQHAVWLIGLDDADGQAGDEPMALSSHLGVFFVGR